MANIVWKSKVEIDNEKQIQESLILELETKKIELENAPRRIAELELENLNLSLAIAEIYETMMGGI